MRKKLALFGALFVLATTAATSLVVSRAGASASTPRYQTRGVLKSFGPERAYANIAHEKIEGYMEAMTMSFEPKSRDQFADLKPGDTLSFTFVALADGRRVIETLHKEK